MCPTNVSIADHNGVSSGARTALRRPPGNVVLVRAKPLAERPFDPFGRVAREESAVHGDVAEAGDDVALVGGRDHRGRQRCRQQRLEDLGSRRIDRAGGLEGLRRRRHGARDRGEKASVSGPSCGSSRYSAMR